jgi:hypothetical protein
LASSFCDFFISSTGLEDDRRDRNYFLKHGFLKDHTDFTEVLLVFLNKIKGRIRNDVIAVVAHGMMVYMVQDPGGCLWDKGKKGFDVVGWKISTFLWVG